MVENIKCPWVFVRLYLNYLQKIREEGQAKQVLSNLRTLNGCQNILPTKNLVQKGQVYSQYLCLLLTVLNVVTHILVMSLCLPLLLHSYQCTCAPFILTVSCQHRIIFVVDSTFSILTYPIGLQKLIRFVYCLRYFITGQA